ncbi:acyltransferase family protein [Croceibacterium mercuriale]|uniref:acyltransferase family protein n=1 Tax=Croceibacterium mercuriale TaxID=1572751 RepID=UPI0013791BFE|nr:acyltransferase [Croceibacterium mercuriale]
MAGGSAGAPRQMAGRHFPQLDGLRALAVMCVLITHYWLQSGHLGHLGVRLFFVLSGFLITGILLEQRPAGSPAPLGPLLRSFYARRILRLFPTYYLMLATGVALNVEGVRGTSLYHATFLSNLWYARHPDWEPWTTVHLWTLAVEEQFYLVWPLVILLLPRRWLLAALVATIAGGIAFRILCNLIWPGMPPQDVLMPAMMDALALGGLIAALVHRQAGDPAARERLLQRLGGASLLCLALVGASVLIQLPYAITDFACTVPMAFLVLAARHGIPGAIGRALAWRPVRYLGRISYGLYIWHIFAWVFLIAVLPGLDWGKPGPATFVVATLVAIAMGAASWHWVEQPFNRLKHLFPYARGTAPQPAPV